MIIKHNGRIVTIKENWKLKDIPNYNGWGNIKDESVKRQLIRADLFAASLKEKEDELFFNNLKLRNEKG